MLEYFVHHGYIILRVTNFAGLNVNHDKSAGDMK